MIWDLHVFLTEHDMRPPRFFSWSEPFGPIGYDYWIRFIFAVYFEALQIFSIFRSCLQYKYSRIPNKGMKLKIILLYRWNLRIYKFTPPHQKSLLKFPVYHFYITLRGTWLTHGEIFEALSIWAWNGYFFSLKVPRHTLLPLQGKNSQG